MGRRGGADGTPGLHRSIRVLLGAVRQMEIAGDDAGRRAAHAVLDEAARSIYTLLAAMPAPSDEPAVTPASDTGGSGAEEVGADDTATEV